MSAVDELRELEQLEHREAESHNEHNKPLTDEEHFRLEELSARRDQLQRDAAIETIGTAFSALADVFKGALAGFSRVARLYDAYHHQSKVAAAFGFFPKIDNDGRYVVTKRQWHQLEAAATYPNTDPDKTDRLFGIPVVLASPLDDDVAEAIARINNRARVLLAAAEARQDLRWGRTSRSRLDPIAYRTDALAERLFATSIGFMPRRPADEFIKIGSPS